VQGIVTRYPQNWCQTQIRHPLPTLVVCASNSPTKKGIERIQDPTVHLREDAEYKVWRGKRPL